MIDSIMRHFKKYIVTDKVRYEDDEHGTYFTTSPVEIKKRIQETFKKWMSNLIPDHNLPPKWSSVFAPLNFSTEIVTQLQTNINQEISENEFIDTLKSCNNKSTLEPSLIFYKVLKLLSTKVRLHLLDILNSILVTGQVSTEWLDSEMILLPKPKDWEGDPLLTYPIILLECARKIFLKVITLRLYSQLNSFPILLPYNFADLPRGWTLQPILTLSNLIEHAQENKIQL